MFDCDGLEFNDLWRRGLETGLLPMVLDSLQEQITDFYQKQDERNSAFQIKWETLDENRIKQLTKNLKPQFDPRLYLSQSKLNLGESERRLEEGLHILHGLIENQRIMVQGPPGSGKSTYALDLMVRLCMSKEKRGLYLCWNIFLAARMLDKLRKTIRKGLVNYILHEPDTLTYLCDQNPTHEQA